MFVPGLQCLFKNSSSNSNYLILVVVFNVAILLNSCCDNVVNAKNLKGFNQYTHHSIHERSIDSDDDQAAATTADDPAATKTCESVKHFFDALNVTIYPKQDSTGKSYFLMFLVYF